MAAARDTRRVVAELTVILPCAVVAITDTSLRRSFLALIPESQEIAALYEQSANVD